MLYTIEKNTLLLCKQSKVGSVMKPLTWDLRCDNVLCGQDCGALRGEVIDCEMINSRGNWRNWSKLYSSATLSITNITWSYMGLKPGLRGWKPASNCLSYGMGYKVYEKKTNQPLSLLLNSNVVIGDVDPIIPYHHNASKIVSLNTSHKNGILQQMNCCYCTWYWAIILRIRKLKSWAWEL
jgi:hypothetical protein